MTAALPLSSAGEASPADLLTGWRDIGAALGVTPDVAMRWRLQHRLPVDVERRVVGKGGHTVRRVVARRSALLAARAAMPDVAPPLPRDRARRLALPREVIAQRCPELVAFEPVNIANMIGPQVYYRTRLRNAVEFAPLVPRRLGDIFGRWLGRMKDGATPTDLYFDMLSVPWLADGWKQHDRTVQREARELEAFGLLDIECRVPKPSPGARRTKRQTTNCYRATALSRTMLERLGYSITPELLAALADLDPAAAAAAPASAPGSQERRPAAPASSGPGMPPPRPRTAPRNESSRPPAPPVVVDDEILLALEREPRLSGRLSPDDIARVDAARKRKGLDVAETLCACWYTFCTSQKAYPNLVEVLCKFIGVQKSVTDGQVIQGFLATSPLNRATEDPKFSQRLSEYASAARRPLLGSEGVLDVLRTLERGAFPDEPKALRRHIRTAIEAARAPPE